MSHTASKSSPVTAETFAGERTNRGMYRKPWPAMSWVSRRPGYVLFIVRELTSVALAIYLILFIVFISKLGAGEAAFVGYLATLTSPAMYVVHGILLLGVVWHACTWFNLTPKAMPMRIGAKRVDDKLVAIAMGYGPWVVLTIIILWLSCP